MEQPNVYEEDHIIECNRNNADVSGSDNSDTNAAWTTALGDTVHIEPGDTVSMYAGYVNARGCGTQGRTIELKGETLGKTKELIYSHISTATPARPPLLLWSPTIHDKRYRWGTLPDELSRPVLVYPGCPYWVELG